MEQYNVTGMSCAACSARVEKAVSKVPGVNSCSVSLLTNSMGVEGTASASAIVKAVQDAGYGASPKAAGAAQSSPSAALDALADKWNISVGKTKFQGLWGQGEVDGHKVVLLKPLTYMNLSGDSIAPMAGFFKIPADHVLVLCDDITQAPGKLRIRPSGSAGGHNGLKSIIARLGGENFPRIRIGIGAKPHPDYDLAAWVLGKFPPEDAKAIADRYPDLEAAAKLIMDGKLGLAQSKYNG